MTYSLSIDQLAVGQGESAIIIIRKDKKVEKTILIDGGKAEDNISKIQERYQTLTGDDHKLDFIITSHYDEDHFLGIQKLITNNDAYGLIGDKTKFYDHGAPFDAETITVKTYINYQTCIINFLKDRVIKETRIADDMKILLGDIVKNTIILSGALKNIKTRASHLSPLEFKKSLSDSRLSGLAKEIENYIESKKTRLNITPEKKIVIINFTESLLNKIDECWPTHTSIDLNPKNKGKGILQGKELLNLGKDNAPKLTCIYNFTTGNDENNKSLAFVLSLGRFKFYTAGDLPSPEENTLVAKLKGLSAFKAGHHGAETSTSSKFLLETRPVVCLISCGNNSYKHPNSKLIDRLANSQFVKNVYLTEYGNVVGRDRTDKYDKFWLAGRYISEENHHDGSHPAHIQILYKEGEKTFSLNCIERDEPSQATEYYDYEVKANSRYTYSEYIEASDSDTVDEEMSDASHKARGRTRLRESDSDSTSSAKRLRVA